MQKLSEAFTTGRRSSSGQITIDYYNELVKIWGGSPASEPLSYGTSTTCVNHNIKSDNVPDNTSSSSSNSLSNNTPYNYRHSSNSTLTKRKISINRNEENLDTDVDVDFIDEANSSNENLDENVPLPVSKSTPINTKKKKVKNNISINNPAPKLIENQRKHLERQLSAARRDTVLIQESQDDTMFKRDMDGSNEREDQMKYLQSQCNK